MLSLWFSLVTRHCMSSSIVGLSMEQLGNFFFGIALFTALLGEGTELAFELVYLTLSAELMEVFVMLFLLSLFASSIGRGGCFVVLVLVLVHVVLEELISHQSGCTIGISVDSLLG